MLGMRRTFAEFEELNVCDGWKTSTTTTTPMMATSTTAADDDDDDVVSL